jgi:cytochrome c-type biogenesis protein CcmF
MSLGTIASWVAFFASLVAGLCFLAAAGGREGAWRPGKIAFRVQWAALLGATAFLWYILFTHQFKYQYVASYSSRSMPAHFIYAAFWGGQEGTFLLWALLTATLGLVFMRVRHALMPPAMFFMNLPLVLLTLVTVMRGPFLTFPGGRVPVDGQGLNPLLQDPWMTIHPPVLFIGFSSLVAPFAIAMAALVRRDWDGWVKPVLPWVVFSTAILATGFTMGGVWAYKVLGWGGYWGWDPVENGSLIPWLSNIALLHGLLIQRVTGSLRRTNFFLAVTSYVLVLYASFLTRSGVLADFSVHSFANLGLSGFLLSFLGVVAVSGYGLLLWRMRDIPRPVEPLGNFSRESMMWLGQLVFMLMCALIAVGMSAPLITRLFGPPSNVQTSYYNLVNAPLAIAMGLLLGIAPLMRWRKHEASALFRAALPAAIVAVVLTLLAAIGGVRDAVPLAVIYAAAFALAANAAVTVRGFRAGWKHGIAYLGHAGVAVLLIGVIASSGYGRSAQVQLPKGQERQALGYRLRFDGVRAGEGGKDRVMIAVQAPEGRFEALPAMYWSEFNQGYMKKPHIERFVTHDIYISPLEMVGADGPERGVTFAKGETKRIGDVTWTFVDFDRPEMGQIVRIAARLRAEIGGRTVPVRPVLEMNLQTGVRNAIPDYLPGGASVQIAAVDPNTGRVSLELPGMPRAEREAEILAVEVSTKPLINLVWIGAIITLGSAFLSVWRRILDLRRPAVAGARAAAPAAEAAGAVGAL